MELQQQTIANTSWIGELCIYTCTNQLDSMDQERDDEDVISCRSTSSVLMFCVCYTFQLLVYYVLCVTLSVLVYSTLSILCVV